MRIRLGVVLLALLAVGVLAAPARADQTYILSAPRWTAAHTKAVVTAGGVVTYQNEEAGIAVVSSPNPDFLKRALAGGSITDGARDITVQLPPLSVVTLTGSHGAHVTAGDEPLSTLQWPLKAVLSRQAWKAGCAGFGARVAIVDGGIQDIHPDIAPNLDTGASTSFVPGKAFNEDVGTFWHGTHVAGIVAAADNAFGVIGIAPHATIIGVKVLDNGAGTLSSVLEGIVYAATPLTDGGGGADIINLSLGTPPFKPTKDDRPLINAFNSVLRYAARRGVLVVAAAGNDATDFGPGSPLTTLPADGVGVVTVSATGPVGFAEGKKNFRRIASYTNYGLGFIDVAAPGGDFVLPGEDLCTMPSGAGPITEPCWVFDMVFSTNVNGWAWAAGTSMAAPATSAVAALIKGRHPGIPLGALKARLLQTADDEGKPGYDKFYGHGFVNAWNACVR